MNDTSATSASGSSLLPPGTGAITTVHLVLILLVALAAIAMIVAGVRRSRARKAATREVRQHAEEAGVPPADPDADGGSTTDPVSSGRPLRDEAIAAAPPLQASPAVEAAAAPVSDAVPVGSGDADAPVTQLKGLGPKVAARLGELGITTVGQIAALTDERAAALDAQLGPFGGRMARDRWIEQARLLTAGDRPGFEAVFGRL